MTNLEDGGHWNAGGPKVYSEDDLSSAIEAGVLSTETAIQLRRHVLEARNVPVADEEYFRLINGFNDIFVNIACTLLLLAIGGLCGMAASWLGALAVALASWGLAEYFVRIRRMALPAILLLLTFVGGMALAALYIAEGTLLLNKFSHITAAAFAVLAAGLHWKRFKVPITVACGAASAVALGIFLLALAFPRVTNHLALVSGFGGIAVFVLAMKWDALDPLRQTRRSDVAFWLHLLAAPLMMHPLFLLLGIFDENISLSQAVAVVGIYVAIAYISLCIDRRALMVSSLAYVIYALSAIFKNYGNVSQDFLVTALVIGGALLMLSAGWQFMRSLVAETLPQNLRQWLPPVRGA